MLNPDPRFPNRPQHPDFHRLSALVIDNDQHDADVGAMFRDVVRVDERSLFYMADQRALHAEGLTPRLNHAVLMAAWIDGFVLGARYGRESNG